jgi:Holliday junction DNA helicase RuvA
MIDSLRGRLLHKEPMAVTIDVQGVGYAVAISLQTYEKLPAEGEELMLLTHLHVREDAMLLFGFLHENERSLFRLLQGVSGIGAKTALNVLSKCGASDLREYVATGNVSALTSIPGIGKKTAERLVVELRDKIDRGGETTTGGDGAASDPRGEAIMALLALGYSRPVAEKAVLKALHKAEPSEQNTSGLIRLALRELSS